MSKKPVEETSPLRADEVLLEQYKIYVQAKDRYIRARHEHVRFFVTALFTEALLGVVGLAFFEAAAQTLSNFQLLVLLAVGFLGVITCIFWGARDTLMAYKLLAKACVIQEMEQALAYPCAAKEHEYYKKIEEDNMSSLGKLTRRATNKLSDNFFPYLFAIPYILIVIYCVAYVVHPGLH
jgi:hypothetical protein